MGAYKFFWSERHTKTIEADSEAEAWELLNEDESGEYIYSHDYVCEEIDAEEGKENKENEEKENNERTESL